MHTRLVATREDLQDILTLQRENLREHVSRADAEREGFLTVAHDLDVLARMHALAPSVIAREGDALAGYALVMPLEARDAVPVLAPLFAQFDALTWQGRPLGATHTCPIT